jgi:hypothetical protein
MLEEFRIFQGKKKLQPGLVLPIFISLSPHSPLRIQPIIAILYVASKKPWGLNTTLPLSREVSQC